MEPVRFEVKEEKEKRGLYLLMNDKDHDLLIEVNERGKTIMTILTNHLRHHFAFNMVLLTAVLTLAASIVLLLVFGK